MEAKLLTLKYARLNASNCAFQIGEKDGDITKGCWIFEPEKCIVGQLDVGNHTIKECCEDDGCNYGDGGSIVILDTWLILGCLPMFLLLCRKG